MKTLLYVNISVFNNFYRTETEYYHYYYMFNKIETYMTNFNRVYFGYACLAYLC